MIRISWGCTCVELFYLLRGFNEEKKQLKKRTEQCLTIPICKYTRFRRPFSE
jgi:hypothetical protein